MRHIGICYATAQAIIRFLRGRVQFVADVAEFYGRSAWVHTEMAPETGAINPKYDRKWLQLLDAHGAGNRLFTASDSETRKIAIAHCDTRRAHQQAVDRGHQAAEQGRGGREPDSSSLGHLSPFPGRRPVAASLSAANLCIPDATAMGLFAWQHYVFCIAAKWGDRPFSTLPLGLNTGALNPSASVAPPPWNKNNVRFLT